MRWKWQTFVKKIARPEFWGTLTGLIAAVLVLFHVNALTIQHTVALIASLGAMVTFLLGVELKS